MENNNNFKYTYSAKEQAELKRIREKYENKEESKLDRLRRLDASVTKKAQTVSLSLGIIGILVLGLGMSLAMSEFSEILGAYRESAMLVGIIVGIVGGGIASFAYPIYTAIVKRERKKLAPEIIRLTDELLNQ